MEKIVTRRIEQFTQASQRLGATFVEGDGVYVRLWAPFYRNVDIEWTGKGRSPLKREEDGYFIGHFPLAQAGDNYFFYGDGKRFADPASRHQPSGVSGPSAVVPLSYAWQEDNWAGVPYEQWVIYEIHTGAFSQSHDFSGVIADLPRLKNLGVTTLEIMPVAQFSGSRNWGYDGVFPHAVHNSYGGPAGFKALVDAAHQAGLAVILDVVYNHLGPEGNTLFGCGPYTQKKYQTPWGDAINYDGEHSDNVRRYFLQTIWQWLTEYRLDGLRLDAVHAIYDMAPVSFLQETVLLKEKAEELAGRQLYLIAESDMNDPRLIAPVRMNGIGFDAHWADDLHHALHAALTGETNGYYQDYGDPVQIAQIYKNGVCFEWDYSPFRHRYHGASYEGVDKKRLIVQSQNHDQVGNRLMGERLAGLVDFEKLKLAAAIVLVSPATPLLFMGEEFACDQPFPYFISHDDPELSEAVRSGRQKEWESFNWDQSPPDPADPATFDKAVLSPPVSAVPEKANLMQEFYKALISVSKNVRSMDLQVDYDDEAKHISLNYKSDEQRILAILSFNDKKTGYIIPMEENWECIVNSADYAPGLNKAGPYLVDDGLEILPFSAVVLKSV